MVLVARKSPEDFFALLDEESEDWNLIDLKHVASSINFELEDAIERKLRKTSNGEVSEMQPSTAQRLYSYVMMDPQADKRTAIQVIAELHKELALLEEKESKENDVVPPTKKTSQKAKSVSNKSTTTSLRREMNLLEEVLLENKIENEIDQEKFVPEEVEVDKASGVIAVSGYKMEDDESTTATISSESVDSIEDASYAFYAP